MGDQQPGEPCIDSPATEATDDCDGSGMCWDLEEVDGQLVGTCVQFCTGTPDDPMCPEWSSCQICGGFCPHVCIPECDPLLQNCEEGGTACYWAIDKFQCITTTRGVPTGEPCGFINDCAAGNTCISAEALASCNGDSCCSTWCHVEQPDPCESILPGTVCEPRFEEGTAPPDLAHVGVCAVFP
jgi:hypothetical protein